MIKLIFLMKRKQGIGRDQFRSHYENSHVPLAKQYIGHLLERYVRNYPTFATLSPSNHPTGTQPVPYEFEYDAITEMWLRDEAAVGELTRICNDPTVNPILVDDELKFLERTKTLMVMSEEVESGVGVRS